MNKAISVELHFFLVSILWGIILLLIYDSLRIFRRLIKQNAFFIAIQDFFYWVISSVLIFAMMYKQNNGIIRGFSIMGMLLGMLLYHYLLSDLIVGAITAFIKLLFRPIVFVVGKIKKGILFIGKKGKKVINNLFLRLKKLVKSIKMRLDKNKKKRNLRSEEHKKAKLLKKQQHDQKKQEENQAKLQEKQKKQEEKEKQYAIKHPDKQWKQKRRANAAAKKDKANPSANNKEVEKQLVTGKPSAGPAKSNSNRYRQSSGTIPISKNKKTSGN
ncbi:MAG: hypothetical protein K0S47_1631 [Herbinix sp.]|jgi:spore cortex biosynthesis protein YabQ|nr:hypothetical protein [Herbinix sp.]